MNDTNPVSEAVQPISTDQKVNRKPANPSGLAGFLLKNYLAKQLSQSTLMRSTKVGQVPVS